MDRGKWASNLAVAGGTKYHTITYVSIDYDLLSNLSLSIDTHSYVQQHKLALCLFLLYYLQHIINLLYSSPHVHQRADATPHFIPTPPYTNPNPRLAPGFSSAIQAVASAFYIGQVHTIAGGNGVQKFSSSFMDIWLPQIACNAIFK